MQHETHRHAPCGTLSGNEPASESKSQLVHFQTTLDIVDYKILIMKIVLCLCSNCSCSTFNQPKLRLDVKAQSLWGPKGSRRSAEWIHSDAARASLQLAVLIPHFCMEPHVAHSCRLHPVNERRGALAHADM